MSTNPFPTDKDVYQITDTVLRQTECNYVFGKDAATFTIKFAGVTSDVVNLAGQFRQGIRVKLTDLMTKFNELSGLNAATFSDSGKVMTAQSTTKKGHGQALITVSVPYSSKINLDGAGAGEAPPFTKIVEWNEKSTKYEFPLQVYAGDVASDSTEYANAGDYGAWLAEENKNVDNYKNFCYELSGNTVNLSGNTLLLAKKHYGGIESVERAYPEVARTSTYNYLKGNTVSSLADLLEEVDEQPNLYQIDTVPISAWLGKFPGYSWLKTAYDVDVQATEYEKYWNVTVKEAWMGIDEDERGPWDENLYSELSVNRWAFYTKQLSA